MWLRCLQERRPGTRQRCSLLKLPPPPTKVRGRRAYRLVDRLVAGGRAHGHGEVFDVGLPVGAELEELDTIPLLSI
jgi:hypothetical protein